MASVPLRGTYSRIDDFFDHRPDTPDSIALTTFASRSLAEPASDTASQFGYSSTYDLQHDSHPVGGLAKRSTTTAFSGWRLGAWTGACSAIVSLIVNLVAAIYLTTRPKTHASLVEVYRGDCDKVQSLDLWIHLLINLISTLLLGGSNYCMQCLCSPSRDELDRAHAKGVPLDIGVPSPRNLFAVGVVKRLLWWILALSSIPLHLIYNSAFYTSIGVRDYNFYIVQPDFLTGTVTYKPTLRIYNTSNPHARDVVANPAMVYQNYTKVARFQNLTNLECIRAYAQVIPTDWSTLLLVTSGSSSNFSVVDAENYIQIQFVNPEVGWYNPYYWICPPPQSNQLRSVCDDHIAEIESAADNWRVLNQPIDYCLAEPAEQQCSFSGNLQIVVAVLICNLIKAIVMVYVAARLPGSPLITIGDAIQSFLDQPDPTTTSLGWTTRRHILDCATYAYHFPDASWPANTANAGVKRQTVSVRDRRWFNAAGHTRWISTVISWSVALLASLGLFIFGYLNIYQTRISATTTRSIKQLGFGELQPLTIISSWYMSSPTGQILMSVLIANSPQIILSFLYLNLNGIVTTMWLAEEWHGFATQRKYLRVSSPRGNQRSTHFLQLPYKISVPLMVASGLLHWLVSRSLFLAVISQYDQEGNLVNPLSTASCGYSLLPMLITIIIGLVAVITALCLGFRRYDGRIPLVGSCSAAISAACHRPKWDDDAALKPVQFGQLTGRDPDSDVGHCCFTSAEVEFVTEGKMYTGGERR